MQDHSGGDGRGGILPIPFLRAVLTGSDDHVRDVLRVGHIAWRSDPDFGERIKAGAVRDFNR